jgi:hypothetical protein
MSAYCGKVLPLLILNWDLAIASLKSKRLWVTLDINKIQN